MDSMDSPSPFGTFDAMSLAPVHDIPQLTVSPSQTTLKFGESESTPETTPEITVDEPPDEQDLKPEKKPVKKRKSWGQELPVPKTNLPPRKRAKTEDEKEQRRIERVLRNRAAAQTSRERKRLEVEKLEGEKQEIEQQNNFLLKRLSQMESENTRLSQEVAKLSSEVRGSRGATPQSVRETESPTLSPTLFKQERDDLTLDKIPFPTPPASHGLTLDATDLNEPSDMTQHPAAVLCDLQCQSEEDSTVQKQPLAMSPHHQFTLALQTIIQHLFLTMISAAYSTVALPMSQIFHSLKTGSPMTFSPEEIFQRLPLILWLISTPTRSTLKGSRPRPVLQIRLLTRLLACSPALARPLRDATSRALQLAPSESSSSPLTVGPGWMSLLLTTIRAIDRIRGRASPLMIKYRARLRIKRSYSQHSLRAKRSNFRRLRSSRRRMTC